MSAPYTGSGIEVDALCELIVVGGGAASRSLSSVLGRRILSRPPVVRRASEMLRTGARGPVVSFDASGELDGLVTFSLDESSGESLLPQLLGRNDAISTAEAASVICELANIVASQSVSAIADAIGARILISVPTLASSDVLAFRVGELRAELRVESELLDREGDVQALLAFYPRATKRASETSLA